MSPTAPPPPEHGELDTERDDDLFAAELLTLLAEDLRCAPPSELRERLLRAPLTGRLARFAESVARLLDVDLPRARTLLDGIDAPGAFEPGPFPEQDIALCHVVGGPAVADAVTGFVRMGRGVTFPHHEHLGEEHVLILQGHCVELGTGIEARPGDIITRPGGSSHALTALPGGTDLLYLAVVQRGVKIGDAVMGPESPEL